MSDDFQEFRDFLNGVHAIPDRLRNRASRGASDRHQMALGAKAYLQKQYEGVEVVRSFKDETGAVFDCVTFESQPSMRGVHDTRIPTAPDLSTFGSPEDSQQALQRSSYMVPSGSVAIRRITVEDILEFGGVDRYFDPINATALDADGNYHHYAIGKQAVNNYGSHAKMSIHKNPVNATKGEVFSLVQTWTYSTNPTQSIEPVVYCNPTQFRTTDPVLIISSTNDGYKIGSYVVNLQFPAFVQTSNKWILGGPVLPYSEKGGKQYYLTVATKYSDDKWWVYVGGETSADAIGYYPKTWFSSVTANGMAKNATGVDAGGEVMAGPRTPQTLPPMGSGALGTASWKNVAYVRDIRYYPLTGGSTNATMSVQADTDKNYSATRVRYKSPWNETIWYGGPGVP